MAVYALPDILSPYDYAALEPHISGQIMELHHDKHHAGYVKGANAPLESWPRPGTPANTASIVGLQKTLAFNLSGHVLHSLFWQNLAPTAAATRRRAGRRDRTRASARSTASGALSQATTTMQGSGWGAGLGPAGGRLIVQQVYDHQGNSAGAQPAARVRRLGARLLPAVQEREGRLRQSHVESGELAQRRGSVRGGDQIVGPVMSQAHQAPSDHTDLKIRPRGRHRIRGAGPTGRSLLGCRRRDPG